MCGGGARALVAGTGQFPVGRCDVVGPLVCRCWGSEGATCRWIVDWLASHWDGCGGAWTGGGGLWCGDGDEAGAVECGGVGGACGAWSSVCGCGRSSCSSRACACGCAHISDDVEQCISRCICGRCACETAGCSRTGAPNGCSCSDRSTTLRFARSGWQLDSVGECAVNCACGDGGVTFMPDCGRTCGCKCACGCW